MNRPIAAIAAVLGAIVAIVIYIIVVGSAAGVVPGPIITSTPFPSPPAASADGGETEEDVERDELLDISAQTAAAEAFAREFYTFELGESEADRAARLAAAGLFQGRTVGIPVAAAPEVWDQVDVNVSVRASEVELVAYVGETDVEWQFSVFVITTADYSQAGSAQTSIERAELVVSISKGNPAIVLGASERL